MSNSDTNWDCLKCGFTNNPRRTHCYKCWARHSDTGDKPGKHGDVYSAGEDLENQEFGCTCGFTTVSAEVMSNHLDEPLPPPTQPTDEPKNPELTQSQRDEITHILETYRKNPSNSNKYRIGLFAYIEDLLAQPQVAETTEHGQHKHTWKCETCDAIIRDLDKHYRNLQRLNELEPRDTKPCPNCGNRWKNSDEVHASNFCIDPYHDTPRTATPTTQSESELLLNTLETALRMQGVNKPLSAEFRESLAQLETLIAQRERAAQQALAAQTLSLYDDQALLRLIELTKGDK